MENRTDTGMVEERLSRQRRFGVDDGVADKVDKDGGRTKVRTSGASLYHLYKVGRREHGAIKEGVYVV